MRLIWLTGGLAIAALAFAQQAPQRGMYGGISTGQMVGSVADPGFAGRMGATVSGLPQTTTRIPINGGIYGNSVYGNGGQGRGSHGHGYNPGSSRARTIAIPYGIPIVYGNSSYDQAPLTPMQQPVMDGGSQPSLIINQYFTPDVEPPPPPRTTRRREPAPEAPKETASAPANPSAPQPNPTEATVTMLAFKDQSTAQVIAYWAQNNDLHYITKNYKKNVVPLGTLDRATSEKLNRDRQVEFTLE